MAKNLTKTPAEKHNNLFTDDNQERGLFVEMKVKIRSQQKCPVCGGNYKLMPTGLLCPKHPKAKPNSFYLDWWYLGENFRLYDFPSFREAFTKAGAIEQEIQEFKFRPERYKGVSAKVNKKFAFEERFETWMKTKKPNLKPAYFRKIEQYREEYVSFFGREDIRTIGADRIMSYHESMFGKIGQKTQYNKMGVLHSFFKSLLDREAIHSMPKFPNVSFKRKEPVWISADEQLEILNEMPEQYRAIFMFLFLTGCRFGEARALHWDDINFEKEVIIIRHNFSDKVFTTPKDGEERQVPMTRVLREVLSKHPRTLHCKFVFSFKGKPYYESLLGKIWRKACKEVGIEGVRPYDGTRHSFASQLVNRGKSLEIIGEILGHSDIRTTKKYAHVHLDAMRKAMEE